MKEIEQINQEKWRQSEIVADDICCALSLTSTKDKAYQSRLAAVGKAVFVTDIIIIKMMGTR